MFSNILKVLKFISYFIFRWSSKRLRSLRSSQPNRDDLNCEVKLTHSCRLKKIRKRVIK